MKTNLILKNFLTFSIICATKNEERDIHLSIESSLNQSYPAHEIIYVDDSEDNTVNVIKSYNNQKIKIINGHDCGCCKARNQGIMNATGDIIVFTNADILLPSNYLELLAKIYQNDLVHMTISDSEVYGKETIYERYVEYIDKKTFPTRNPWTSQGYSVRKNIALEVGLISAECIKYNVCRDWTLGYKIQKAGYNKIILYGYKVLHKCPDSLKEFWVVRKTRGLMSTYSKFFYQNMNKILIFMIIIFRFFILFLSTIMLIRPIYRLLLFRNLIEKRKFEMIKFILIDFVNFFSFSFGEIQSFCKILSKKSNKYFDEKKF